MQTKGFYDLEHVYPGTCERMFPGGLGEGEKGGETHEMANRRELDSMLGECIRSGEAGRVPCDFLMYYDTLANRVRKHTHTVDTHSRKPWTPGVHTYLFIYG